VPINYPDGMECKPAPEGSFPELAPPHGFQGQGLLPAPHLLSAADKQAVAFFRQIYEHPDASVYRVSHCVASREFARYSDRYLGAPPGTGFSKSPQFSLRVGEHYPAELNPGAVRAAQRKQAKRGRSARPPHSLHGVSWADDAYDTLLGQTDADGLGSDKESEAASEAGSQESASKAEMRRERKRLKRLANSGKGQPKSSRFNQGDGEAGEADGDDDADDDDDDADDDDDDDAGLSEEEEILSDGGGMEDAGFEDGMDDMDSGGEDEPTY